ncbi:MAG: acyl-CoA dehydrogenase family protein [Acidobacteriota bacterium]|nr:acyl-CoA dehydrogenase family protein [Acidobacteriota bacterium]
MSTDSISHKGGGWLVTAATDIFTPERLSDDHRMIAQTAHEFMTNEVMPAIDRLEQKDWTLARALVAKGGALGLIGTDVPEELGGIGLDKAASIIVGEAAGRSASFATTFGAQTGLSIIPLLCFGTAAQQQKYLPRLASGEIIGAYALSESGSGSDALAARCRAVRQEDGSFVLSGEKMWITNGGFADVFIVFAKVHAAGAAGDGEFSAFIVERAFAGVSNGKEEHKMGLHGSSTTPLILQDAKVPAENLLGAIGKGHKVALNTLNYGRFKLAAMCSGGAKMAIAEAAAYAATRKQFGRTIASFGAIQHKLGEMTARAYAVESMLYRTCGLIDVALGAHGAGPAGEAAAGSLSPALEEFAIEASMLKVASSEMIDYVLDENVQIHGGNGFVKDYPAERHYRDARVNRIFEGTNEINRLLVPGMLARRAVKGTLPLIASAMALQAELLAPPSSGGPMSEPLAPERALVTGMKKAALAVLGTAMQTFGDKLADEQEVLSFTADVLTDAFAAESALLRATQADADDPSRAALHASAARIVIHTAACRIDASAKEALAAMTQGDQLRTLLAALRRWLKSTPANLVADRRALAEETGARKKYVFEIV